MPSQHTNSVQQSSHLLKKLSVLSKTLSFITTHWILSWSKRMESIPSHSISLLLIFILSFHVHLSFSSVALYGIKTDKAVRNLGYIFTNYLHIMTQKQKIGRIWLFLLLNRKIISLLLSLRLLQEGTDEFVIREEQIWNSWLPCLLLGCSYKNRFCC